MKRIMVFGVFDGLHHGHQYLLSEASMLGDELVVVVAPDAYVRTVKQKTPQNSLSERIAAIKQTGKATLVVPGDEKNHTWSVIETHKPDVIALGHDQHILREILEQHTKTLPYPIELIPLDRLDIASF